MLLKFKIVKSRGRIICFCLLFVRSSFMQKDLSISSPLTDRDIHLSGSGPTHKLNGILANCSRLLGEHTFGFFFFFLRKNIFFLRLTIGSGPPHNTLEFHPNSTSPSAKLHVSMQREHIRWPTTPRHRFITDRQSCAKWWVPLQRTVVMSSAIRNFDLMPLWS